MTQTIVTGRTRVLQLYGAICLARFCGIKEISSEHIEALIDHLIGVAIANNLPDWDTKGTQLELSGRGDPFPSDLAQALSLEQAEKLRLLVEAVVEIGLVDLYGAATDRPAEFFAKSCSILTAEGVDVPPLRDFLGDPSQLTKGWGLPLSSEQAKLLTEWCIKELHRSKSAPAKI